MIQNKYNVLNNTILSYETVCIALFGCSIEDDFVADGIALVRGIASVMHYVTASLCWSTRSGCSIHSQDSVFLVK